MPPAFELAPEALRAARADVDRVHAALAAALGDVRAEVTSLVGDGWRGAAATAFGAGYDAWRCGAEQVLAALVGTAEALDDTRTDYVATDDAAAAGLDRLAARLSARLDGAG